MNYVAKQAKIKTEDEKPKNEDESDSEVEDPDDEEVIEKILERLPDEEHINSFLIRSLAIFMLLRWVY